MRWRAFQIKDEGRAYFACKLQLTDFTVTYTLIRKAVFIVLIALYFVCAVPWNGLLQCNDLVKSSSTWILKMRNDKRRRFQYLPKEEQLTSNFVVSEGCSIRGFKASTCVVKTKSKAYNISVTSNEIALPNSNTTNCCF